MKYSAPTLYIYNNVFYPHTIIPLTVADSISQKIIRECHHRNQSVALYHPSERSRGVGTLGKILLLEENDDGSTTVLVQGIVRIKFLVQEHHSPYPTYLFEEYCDADTTSTLMTDSIERLHHVLENWLNRHISSASERTKFLKEMDTPQKLINNLCVLVLKDLELKEIFLENTSLPDRIRMMDALLRGKAPDNEDFDMGEAIKNFERLEQPGQSLYKNAI